MPVAFTPQVWLLESSSMLIRASPVLFFSKFCYGEKIKRNEEIAIQELKEKQIGKVYEITTRETQT